MTDLFLKLVTQTLTDQREIALALGYGADVDKMNMHHDELHALVAQNFNATSHALRQAKGRKLSAEEARLAKLEEVAVLALQRYLRASEAL